MMLIQTTEKTMFTTKYKRISKMSEIVTSLEDQRSELEEQRKELIKRIDRVSQTGTFAEQLKNIQKASRDLTDLCKKIESVDKKHDSAFKKQLEAQKQVGFSDAHEVWYKANLQVIRLSKNKASFEEISQAQEKLDQALANLQEVERKASDIYFSIVDTSTFVTLTPCDPALYEQELERINRITKKKYRF